MTFNELVESDNFLVSADAQIEVRERVNRVKPLGRFDGAKFIPSPGFSIVEIRATDCAAGSRGSRIKANRVTIVVERQRGRPRNSQLGKR